MYTAMIGTAAFIIWQGGVKTAQGLYWFAAGAVFGWPFSAALCLPFIAEDALLAFYRNKEHIYETFLALVRGVVGALLMIVRRSLPDVLRG